MRGQLQKMVLVAAVLLLCPLALAQATGYDRRPRTASVSGRVTIDGKPSPHIRLSITELLAGVREARIFSVGGREFVDRYSYEATTDSDGRYQIGSLPAGEYEVSPIAPAHVPNSRASGLDASTRVTLDEGETREKIDFALVRGGVITGRVTDADGRPQIGRRLRLTELVGQNEFRDVHNTQGRALETDDRGIYRIFGLRRGRYIARAGGEHDTLRYAITGKSTQVTYYADGIRQEDATVIQVVEGKEVTGVDIRLRDPVATYAVAGRAIDSETGKPVAGVIVDCYAVENQDDNTGNSVAGSTIELDGSFTATGLKPGKYKATLASRQEAGDYYSDGTYFEIVDGDVNGVVVVGRRGAAINGTVIVEDSRDESVRAKLSEVALYVSIERGSASPPFSRRRSSKITPDGEFRLTGLPPGEAWIELSDSFNAIHLLRIERNGVDVSRGLEVGPGEMINGLRVIVSHGSGSIRGSITIIGGSLPQGVYLAVQAGREWPTRVSGSAEADEKGRFFIKGLPAGEYDLFTYWGTRNDIPRDPNLRIPQPPKQRISVTNGRETQVSLTIDLSRKEQEKE